MMPYMSEMETDRLRLIPLDFESIDPDEHEMIEQRLGLKLAGMILGERIDREIKAAMRTSLEDVIRNKTDDQWYLDWQSVLIVLKKDNIIVGGFCFQMCPDEGGKVQLGYMIRPEYQQNGYMTEALKRGIVWIFERPGVMSMVAETTKSNLPSQRVLIKMGMTVYKETEKSLWWRRGKCA
jgi:RimJ/RimL family protein N-acetyltransferase